MQGEQFAFAVFGQLGERVDARAFQCAPGRGAESNEQARRRCACRFAHRTGWTIGTLGKRMSICTGLNCHRRRLSQFDSGGQAGGSRRSEVDPSLHN